MRNYYKLLCIVGLQLLPVIIYAQQIHINSVHYWTTHKQSRLMIDVSSMPVYRVSLLEHPLRLVVSIPDARIGRALAQPPPSDPVFSRIRAIQNKNQVKITADLKKSVSTKSYALNPNKMYGHRLVIDVFGKGQTSYAGRENKAINSSAASKTVASRPAKSIKLAQSYKNMIVAIDAGHGGDDPGALGPRGTEEKKVVFAIAKKLEQLINAQRGMRAVMVRKGDYYVDLRKRMQIARAAKADLFISIHADAFENATVKGASVYTLSTRGASSEAARWLAKSENASALVGGVSLDDKDEVLASVLLDLSQTATQEASFNVAGEVLKGFENIGELHFGSVQKAGFLVLKSPDIPSILVETAFISNPSEERKLLSTLYQSKIALAIFRGVRNYFKEYTPFNSRIAAL
ncbi:N-acetylmuramoyl-L-alanine amidase [Candidatus Methylobacter favarea]|uniref:N-acetylmuramoyl-L-alanine amidase AmiC n=1 Tax=Candidatus Methylobacter favarea TaxID=2707345 RepID=A0A8S0XHY7_9GAMM|nr:N-acetylmuramoyl-L-alanine amidase [Candidatus Methylobacter favarea]